MAQHSRGFTVVLSTAALEFLEHCCRVGEVALGVERMDDAEITEALLEMLEAAGMAVRQEAMGGSGGGLCQLAGQAVFFVDTDTSSAEQCALCAAVVANRIDTDRVYMRPQVRDMIEQHKTGNG